MMTEKIKFQGRLAGKQLAKKQLTLKIEGLILSIRDILDPFAEIPALKTDIAAEQSIQLAEAVNDYASLQSEIKELERYINV